MYLSRRTIGSKIVARKTRGALTPKVVLFLTIWTNHGVTPMG